MNLRLVVFNIGTKKNFYTKQCMESNYKKYASVYSKLSIKPNFGMCIIDHRSSNHNNFRVHRRYSFSFIEYTNCHTLRPIDSKYLKCIFVLLNFMKLCKINVALNIAFILYAHLWKLCA